MKFCITCRTYHGDTCLPEWQVRVVGEEDWDTIHAVDAQDAAEKFGDEYDTYGDYTILKGETLLVEVSRDGECLRFHVEGESVPRYYARIAVPN